MTVWYSERLQKWFARLADGRVIEVTSDNPDEVPN